TPWRFKSSHPHSPIRRFRGPIVAHTRRSVATGDMHVKHNREKGHWEGEKEGGKRASVTGPTKQPVVVLPPA
ncbi:MAG TPA: hypothetical protein VFY54_16365, partial [Rubrobacter sp.]|nr:hypothetical protein [Rubrobacter sp.]